MTMAGDGSHALLVLGFESTDHPVERAMARALEICAEHGGAVADAPRERRRRAATPSAPGARRSSARPTCATCSSRWACSRETFETAITWERFAALPRARASAAAEQALRRGLRRGRARHCRFTHVYPDGPAPYFTVLAPARRGEEVEQWAAIKRAVSDALIAAGRRRSPTTTPSGATTAPGMTSQRPEPVRGRAAGREGGASTPRACMNPGVLLDCRRSRVRIAVLGPGGVGGLLAAALDRAGERGDRRRARVDRATIVAERGLRVSSVDVRRASRRTRAPSRG